MPTSKMRGVRSAESDSISQAVVSAVAAATGTEPTELEPLYHVVDPDALDRLFRPSARPEPRPAGRVVFTMAGCEVTVHANGQVDVATPSADVSPE